MIVGDVVEELLRIECTTEEESEVPIRRLDGLRYDRHCGSTVKCVFVGNTVFRMLREADELLECIGDARKQRGVDARHGAELGCTLA